MRRLLGVGILGLALAPPAAAAPPIVTVNARPATGFAPLRVTLTAAGDAATYRWALGDGAVAAGASVSHVYEAGDWTATVTATSAAGETAQAAVTVSARPDSIALRRPAAVPWRSTVLVRGRLASNRGRSPVNVYRGRTHVARTLTRAGGWFAAKIRLNVPGRYHARGAGVRSPEVALLAVPRIRASVPPVATRHGPLRLRASVRPAWAGRLEARIGSRWKPLRRPVALSTTRLGPVRVALRLRARPGFVGSRKRLVTRIVEPTLAHGARGPAVRELERRLAALRYALPAVDDRYGLDTVEAVYAFQKLHGLAPTGRVDAWLWRLLARAGVPRARYPGTHIEVDKGRQVLLDVHGGRVLRVVHISTGATGNTPFGSWRVYRKVPGYDWVLYYPLYFLRGFAVHGYPSVPPYPASHGCVRVPMWLARSLYEAHGHGATVVVY